MYHFVQHIFHDAQAEQGPTDQEQSRRIIKDAYKDAFLIGMAGDLPGRYSEQEMSLAAEHFNAITPENCMKPERVHPEGSSTHYCRPLLGKMAARVGDDGFRDWNELFR